MKGIPYVDVSYCKYGLPYRKQTRLWTNLPLKLLICNRDCNFMVKTEKGLRHIGSTGCGGTRT